jgi:hypothetical protein
MYVCAVISSFQITTFTKLCRLICGRIDLGLTWGLSMTPIVCSNIEQVDLTWSLLSVPIKCISSENQWVSGIFVFFLLTKARQWSVLRHIEENESK